MDLNKAYIYRMTHIENIPHILENGITHKDSVNHNPNYIPIGDSSLISTRDSFEIPNGDTLGEYIPFYFGLRTPMLFVIQKGYNDVAITQPGNIIYCVSSVQKVLDLNLKFIYTNGHATDSLTSYFLPNEIENIDEQVDFDATNAKYWKRENDLDFKRRKEAEFLIKNDFPVEGILGYIVYSQNTQNKLIEFGINQQIIAVRPTYYF